MKMKQFKRTIVLLVAVITLLCLFSLGASANEEMTSGDFTYVVQEDNTVKIIGYSGGEKDVVIPSEIDGFTVTVVGNSSFDSKRVKSVTIPKEITLIEANAFYFCSVTAINVSPENTEYSSDENGVLFNKDKTVLIKFASGSEIKEYVMPDTVTSISRYAFIGAYSLKAVTFPESLTVINKEAFECSGFETLIIPGSIKTIESLAFSDCSGLRNIYLEKGIEEIEHNAFYNCEDVNVFFSGTKNDWNSVDVANTNEILREDNVHYNASYPFDHAAAYTLSLKTPVDCEGIVDKIYTCSCGDSYSEKLYSPGHTGGTATCSQKAICTRCSKEYGALKKHAYKTVISKANVSKNGKIEVKCSSCGAVDKNLTTVISYPKTISLSKTNYIYDGKNKTPTVTVMDAEGKKLVKNTDYKLSVASNRSGIGRYTVKVTFIGNYSGTKNLYFYIKPGKPATVKAASQTASSIKLSWSAVPGAVGYTVYRYSPSKKAYVNAGTATGTSLTVKSLNSATNYTFRVVAYGKTSAGKVYNSDSYALLKTATKPGKPSTVKASSQTASSVKLSWSAVTRATGYTVYRYSPSKKAYVKAGSTTGKTYTVKNLYAATQYTFRVVAYFKASDGKVYNSDSYASIKTATKPSTATVTLKADAPGQLTLEWKAVSGANTYNVYYKVNGGSYKLYKTYASAQKITFKNLKGGDNYTIAVKAGIKVTGGTVWGDVSAKSAKVAYRTPRYLNTMKSGTYYLRYEISGVEFAEAMKGNLLYATGYDDYGDQYRMVYNGSTKKWYYIYDQYKLYTIIKDSDLPAEARGSEAIKSVKNQQVPTSFKSTKEQIYGETLFCESAKVNGLNTKYCYSGTRLAFVIVDLGNGIQVTQYISEFTNNVPNSLFTIPSDYKYVA